MVVMKSIGNAPASKAHASTALAVLSERKKGFVASTIIQPDTLDTMIANIKLELGLSLTINNTGRKKYRRNDRIKVRSQDGLIVEDKYKRLEAGIRDGVYQIIEE